MLQRIEECAIYLTHVYIYPRSKTKIGMKTRGLDLHCGIHQLTIMLVDTTRGERELEVGEAE
jgi:hypothetical protein